ncbi:hypothetical protein MKW98_027744 [Papaver atlanticum]|uniref:Uncharacterized protein n=1 Tax=Papaver atlanticum TaxID=357466 RepID=A0AAD4T9F7_9MAGN|nr:hypothetical protein MKW98_027744 [Papaver atlanticum]
MRQTTTSSSPSVQISSIPVPSPSPQYDFHIQPSPTSPINSTGTLPDSHIDSHPTSSDHTIPLPDISPSLTTLLSPKPKAPRSHRPTVPNPNPSQITLPPPVVSNEHGMVTRNKDFFNEAGSVCVSEDGEVMAIFFYEMPQQGTE